MRNFQGWQHCSYIESYDASEGFALGLSSFLQRHSIPFDVLVDLRLRKLPLIDVKESLGERNVVGFRKLAFVVEQELADVLAVGSAIVVAKEGKTFPFPCETSTKQGAEGSSLRPAFNQRC